MANKNKYIRLLLVASFAASICTAQKQEGRNNDSYRAVLWSVDDGLGKERWHTCFLKDVNGFLWVGSNYGELTRFDGNSFQQYAPDAKKPGMIHGNNCQNFVEDSMHNIWIGLIKGLARYDIKADTFTNFKSSIDTASEDRFVLPFWAGRDRVLCLEAGGWITEVNVHSFVRKKLLNIDQILKSGKIKRGQPAAGYIFFDASANNVWMLCHDEDGLAKISATTGSVMYFTRKPYKKTPFHNDAEAMIYDRKRNCLWINSHDGLTQFTLTDEQFHHIDALNFLVSRKDYDRYVGIDMDPQGRIWFATIPKGIIIYDPATQTITDPIEDSTVQTEVADGNLKIYCDKDGIVWASYWSVKGIYQLIPFSKAVYRYSANHLKTDSLISLFIQNMVPGPHGELWIGTRYGLNIYNPVAKSFSVLEGKSLRGIIGKNIVPMVIDTIQQKAWLNGGPPDRVYEMDMKTRKCKHVIFKDTAGRVIEPGNIINSVSVAFNKGMLFYDAVHGIFEVPAESAEAKLIIPITGVFDNLVIGKDNKLFIHGFHSVTYQYKNGKWQKIHSLLDSLSWSDIYYDKTDDTYWVSIENEIIHYDNSFQLIRVYSNEDGLISTPFTILPDGLGNIWFNNDRKNISNLNSKTGIITTLTEQDGYQKQSYDWTTPRGKISGGELYFTGNPLANNIGLDRISPAKFASGHISRVYFKSLKINQKPLFLGINNTEKLSLRYFENKISIETGIINHYIKGRSRIRYRMDKLDTSWQYAPYYYTIRYEELPPGEYTLQLQASNSSNEFNGPVKTLMINISPALWNTWWFRLIALAFLIDLIYTFIRWRFKQKYKLQLERSEKEKQIADVRRKATELEMQALRAQMNPHFIFNSLNSINRFILQNNKAQASEYLTKFSKLVRMILQNSQASLISLEAELEALDLYLEMEALRFNYHFDYKITTSKDLDIEVLQVPPLILQPYVENAIWHGLMHKEERGHLNIEVLEKDDQLYFSIEDNGIGRQKSKELASKTATKHKSMGLRITANRIAILQKNGSTESPVTIRDLVDSNGVAAGTEVIIKMPLLYD